MERKKKYPNLKVDKKTHELVIYFHAFMQIFITDVRFVGDEMTPFTDLILDDLEILRTGDLLFLSAPK